MLQLRSKKYFLTLGITLGSVCGLNAGMLYLDNGVDPELVSRACACGKPKPQKDQTLTIETAGCTACKPRPAAKPKNEAIIEEAACTRCKPRPLPPSKEEAIYKQMAHIASKTKRALSQTGANKDVIKTLQARSLCSKNMPVFPKAPNYLQEISPNADTITLENGSAWAIAENDQMTAKAWSAGTALVITPNKLSIWSKLTRKELRYKYRFVNLETNAYVQTNLSLGPFCQNPYTLKIRKINTTTGEVSFTNGTLWKLDTSKISAVVLKDWELGDYVMTGKNTTWFGFGLPDIVINVTRNSDWLPAQRLY